MPKHTARLILRGYYGEQTYDAQCHSFTAQAVLNAAQRARRSRGIALYGDHSAGQEKDLDALRTVGPRYVAVFPSSKNADGAWTKTFGTGTYLEYLPKFGGTGSPGYYHSNNAADDPFKYSGPSLTANEPFAFRFWLSEAPQDQTRDLKVLKWDLWRLEIESGSARLLRYATSYFDTTVGSPTYGTTVPLDSTQRASLQADLDELLLLSAADENGLTASEQDEVNEIEAKLYEVNESISLGVARKGVDSAPIELTFLPEARGKVEVVAEGAGPNGRTVVDIPSIQKAKSENRTAANVWNAGALSIESLGGAFMWQRGVLRVNKKSLLRLGPTQISNEQRLLAPAPTFTSKVEVPTGCNVTLAKEILDLNVVEYKATFESNGTHLPRLYSGEAFTPAGPRNGSDATAWDSATHPLSTDGTCPFIEITPQLECDMRRASYVVTMWDVDGMLELPSTANRVAVHDRLCDLYIDGQLVLKGGVVKEFTHANMAQAGPFETEKPTTKAVFTICDPWCLLEEQLLQSEPELDGYYLSDAIRLILADGGWKTSEMAGVPTGLGKKLQSAVAGEPASERPAINTSRADLIRSLLEKYGLNLDFWWDGRNGTWKLGTQDTTIRAAFTSDPDNTDFATFVKDPLDVTHDYADFHNAFAVRGRRDPETGQYLSRVYKIWESFRQSEHKSFIGRVKWLPWLIDSALKTVDDLTIALRSLVFRHGQNGIFLQFETFYNPNLFPGDYVTFNGTTYQIRRIPGGSVQRDTMTLVIQAVGP